MQHFYLFNEREAVDLIDTKIWKPNQIEDNIQNYYCMFLTYN